MKVLHTSDWHVGKGLGRFSRQKELEAALGEMANLVEDQQVDMVLMAGDLFDKKRPDDEAIGVALRGLIRLTLGGKVPVVAIAGNHDKDRLIENLSEVMELHRVYMVGTVRPPARPWLVNADGAPVVAVEAANGEIASIGAFPFVRETQLFHTFDIRPGKERGTYAERMREVCAEYSEAAIREAVRRDGKSFLMGHFLISGSRVLGGGMPRGEKALDMSDAYATTQQTVDTGVDYVAMGHVHAPQALPGVHAPGAYSGSLLQSDFGERGEQKRVIICDTDTDPVGVTSIPLSSGRELSKVDLQWGETPDDGVDEHYVDVTISHPEEVSVTEMRKWAEDNFPRLVWVRTKLRGDEQAPTEVKDDPKLTMSVADQWVEFRQATQSTRPPDKWVETMRHLETEAIDL